MSEQLNGIIMHAISGFYYVEAAGFVYECKAKGNFRARGITPLTGDHVVFEPDGDKGFILSVTDRKNFLQRPPIANLSRLFLVSSADRPKPNLYVLDKLTAFAVYHDVEPVIVFSKTDLADVTDYARIYKQAGFRVLCCCAKTGEGLEELRMAFSDGINAFSGNSGVGKSSLLNALLPGLALETNEISEKLGRGRHTTRSVRLYHFGDALLADTPGFSSIDFEENGETIRKEALPGCFPEFAPYLEDCRFSPSCRHLNDKGCAVVRAVQEGKIPVERHRSYCQMYEAVRDFKDWNRK